MADEHPINDLVLGHLTLPHTVAHLPLSHGGGPAVGKIFCNVCGLALINKQISRTSTERSALSDWCPPFTNCTLKWGQVGCSNPMRERKLDWFLGYFSKERRFSIDPGVQDVSSNSFSGLWKRNDSSVVIQTWCWQGKPAASARAYLRDANAER